MAIRQGTPPPLTNSLRTRWPGPLGATRALVDALGRDDLAEVDVEPVRAEQQVAGPEVRLDVAGVDVALDLVGQEDVDQVARLGGLGGRDRLEAVLDRQVVVGRARPLADDDRRSPSRAGSGPGRAPGCRSR